MTGLALTVGAVAGLVVEKLDRYSTTSHGPNKWTFEAALHALALSAHFETARRLVAGKITSAYRSAEVNAKIPGASPTSRHMAGLAVDIVPAGMAPAAAAALLFDAAEGGALGPVRMVIVEPTWVHVDWFAPGEITKPPTMRQKQ